MVRLQLYIVVIRCSLCLCTLDSGHAEIGGKLGRGGTWIQFVTRHGRYCHHLSCRQYSYNGMPLTLHYTYLYTYIQCYNGVTCHGPPPGPGSCEELSSAWRCSRNSTRCWGDIIIIWSPPTTWCLVDELDVKNVPPLAGSAGKEEENGNQGQEQQTPGEIHSEAHCSQHSRH